MARARPLTRRRTIRRSAGPRPAPALALARRRRPRPYPEWKALRAWNLLPEAEADRAGYLLRLARERAGLTQAELARRLGLSQQAVARAERWDSNPTVDLMRVWGTALGARLEVALRFEE